jgi:hypothetical protein
MNPPLAPHPATSSTAAKETIINTSFRMIFSFLLSEPDGDECPRPTPLWLYTVGVNTGPAL